MDYEWDSAKAKDNAGKRGVDLADALIALIDLLSRLDASLKYSLDNEEFIDEINSP